MSEEGLKIKLGADDAELQQGLQRAGTSIENFGHHVSASTFLARNAVLDFGHTLRDLPYAIYNPALLTGPIDRTVQLFTQLQQQGGGVKGALQSIGSVLSGSGGILIGFELLTTAAAFFFGRSKSGAQDTQKAVESLSDSIKKIPLVEAEAGASEAGNIAKVKGLAAVIENTNVAYSDRKHALEELREINKSYFGDLTLEDSATGKLTKTINEYSKALIAEAIQKKFISEIADAAVKESDAQDARAKAYTKVAQAQVALNKANSDAAVSDPVGTQGISNTREQTKAQNDLVDATEALYKANENALDQNTRRVLLEDKLNKVIAEGAKIKPLKDTEGNSDALKREIEATQKLRDELDKLGIDSTDITEKLIALKKQLLFRDAGKLGLDPQEINAQVVALNRELQDAFDKQGARFEIKAQPTLDIKPADLSKLAADADKIVNPFSKAVEKLFKEQHPSKIFSDDFIKAIDDMVRHLAKLKTEAINMGKALEKNVKPAFDVFFDDLLNGKGAQAFADFGKAIEDIIKKLIAAALEALIFNSIIGIATGGVKFGGGAETFLGGFKNLFGGLSGINLNSANAGGITGTGLMSISIQPGIAFHGNNLVAFINKINKTNNRIH